MDIFIKLTFVICNAMVVLGVTFQCPPNIKQDRFLRLFETHCYQFILDHPGDWFHADSDCRAKGGYLTDIHSTSEQAFIYNSLQFLGLHGDKGIWIGLTDRDQEGTWKWTSGANVNFNFWARGQPGGLVGGSEDCALLQISTGGTWHDYPCECFLLIKQNHGWVCKFAAIPSSTMPPAVTSTKLPAISSMTTSPETFIESTPVATTPKQIAVSSTQQMTSSMMSSNVPTLTGSIISINTNMMSSEASTNKPSVSSMQVAISTAKTMEPGTSTAKAMPPVSSTAKTVEPLTQTTTPLQSSPLVTSANIDVSTQSTAMPTRIASTQSVMTSAVATSMSQTEMMSNTSQQPIMTSSVTLQQPMMTSSNTPQQPVVTSSNTSQQPVMTSSNNSQQPVLMSSNTSQQQVMMSSNTSQQPVMTSSNTPQQPVMTSSNTFQQPVMMSSSTSQQPLMVSSYTPQQAMSTTLKAITST